MYNKLYAGLASPAVMVLANGGGDVVTTLTIAQAFNQTVAVRSAAGHSYVAQSTTTGIVLSLQNLKVVNATYDAASGSYIAYMQGGVKLIEAYSRLARMSPALAMGGGTCPSVGLSGLAQGGGHGFSSPRYDTVAQGVGGARRRVSWIPRRDRVCRYRSTARSSCLFVSVRVDRRLP